jgi:hypothetical protein
MLWTVADINQKKKEYYYEKDDLSS